MPTVTLSQSTNDPFSSSPASRSSNRASNSQIQQPRSNPNSQPVLQSQRGRRRSNSRDNGPNSTRQRSRSHSPADNYRGHPRRRHSHRSRSNSRDRHYGHRNRSRSHRRQDSRRNSHHRRHSRSRSPRRGLQRQRSSRSSRSNAEDSASARKEKSLQGAHRKLVRQLQSNKTGKSALASADKLSQYKTAASFLVRGVHLFINPKLMFRYGLLADGLDLTMLEADEESDKENTEGPGGNPGDDEDEDDSIFDAIFAKQYQDFIKSTPGLMDTMSRFKKDHRGLLLFIDLIHETARTARGSDIKGFKSHIGKYLLKDPATDLLDPPVVDDGSKSNRGFSHPQFAPLLVPFDHYCEYLKDPTGFCTLILNKDMSTDIKIDNASGVPMLLYDIKLYNPEDREAGWGRSFLLVRCLKHFLNGPGSVFRDPESAKSLGGLTIRRIYKIKQLTPQLIAYVACMIRFALCSSSRFCNMDRHFSLRKFYDRIIFFLEDPDDWSKEIIDFLNDQVFVVNDDDEGQEITEDGNATDPEVRIIRASRERRRKEKEVAEKAAAELAAAELVAVELAATEKAAAELAAVGKAASEPYGSDANED